MSHEQAVNQGEQIVVEKGYRLPDFEDPQAALKRWLATQNLGITVTASQARTTEISQNIF